MQRVGIWRRSDGFRESVRGPTPGDVVVMETAVCRANLTKNDHAKMDVSRRYLDSNRKT